MERAEASYRAALAIAEEIGDAIGVSGDSWNLGLLYEKQARVEEALALLERCVEIEERLGLPDAAKHRRRVGKPCIQKLGCPPRRTGQRTGQQRIRLPGHPLPNRQPAPRTPPVSLASGPRRFRPAAGG